MINRNIVRSSALAVIAAVTLFSASTIARSSNQKPGQPTEASLMTVGDGVPGAEVVLKKKPGGQPQGSARKNKDGSFAFDNVPVGTYTLTFDVPKLSPALAGKVEYLVIVQQVQAGGAGNSTAKTYSDSKSNTARLAPAKIKDGFDFTVGPQPQEGAINVAKSNIRNSPPAPDPQSRKVKQPPEQMAGPETSIDNNKVPQAMNIRGKIFLVEIGTTNAVRQKANSNSN